MLFRWILGSLKVGMEGTGVKGREDKGNPLLSFVHNEGSGERNKSVPSRLFVIQLFEESLVSF